MPQDLVAKMPRNARRLLGYYPSESLDPRAKLGMFPPHGVAKRLRHLLDTSKRIDPEEGLKTTFKAFDKSSVGFISVSKLRKALINPRSFVGHQLAEKLTGEEVDELMTEADVDGDGQINYEEFVKLMALLQRYKFGS